ncbi:MAG TPA: RAMP superfamily CRISPR-associated protein [Dehalococcoidia bacterium]|nr:RAMP superfamily CRISPR-associated protein [Dehalococcoidia bacterium]
MTQLEISIRFELDTALHITGNRRVLGVDRPLALGTNGRPVIPATTIKGFLRDRAELLLTAFGQKVCRGPQPRCWDTGPCLVCRVFGNPRQEAALRFNDAVPASQVAADVRAGVGISRLRKAAITHRLFFVETTTPGPSSWLASCTGYFADEGSAREAAALLDLACRWPWAVGGGKTRGLGWIGRLDLSARVDGATLTRHDLVAIWQTWRAKPHVATP